MAYDVHLASDCNAPKQFADGREIGWAGSVQRSEA